MPQLQKQIYTSKDYWNLPDSERAELINGQLYAMAPPSRIHQELIMELSATIRNYIKDNNGDCKVYPAPFAVDLAADDETWVEPDISVICNNSKLNERGCKGAPDFIIEIVSPNNRKLDYSTKLALYSDAGVREYWIVDPDKKRTTVYYFEEDAAPAIIPFDHILRSGVFERLQITISTLI